MNWLVELRQPDAKNKYTCVFCKYEQLVCCKLLLKPMRLYIQFDSGKFVYANSDLAKLRLIIITSSDYACINLRFCIKAKSFSYLFGCVGSEQRTDESRLHGSVSFCLNLEPTMVSLLKVPLPPSPSTSCNPSPVKVVVTSPEILQNSILKKKRNEVTVK